MIAKQVLVNRLKQMLIIIGTLIGSAIIGTLLLIIAYCLPTERIAENIRGGVETLLIEGSTFEYAQDYKAAILDNVTDAIMLSEAVFPTQDPIHDAMAAPRYGYEERNTPELSLMAYLNNDTTVEREVVTYSRYWHGYLVILKPFFSLFDFSDSRMFHLGFQIILFVAAIYWLDKRNMKNYILPLTLLQVLWNPATIGMCMQYYACFYITFFAIIIMLWKKEYLDKSSFRFQLFFMLIGICTSYFDFLTYPIATLGIPLTIWLLFKKEEKNRFVPLVINSVFWAIGYLGMWVQKWIIASIILNENIVLDAVKNVISRTSTDVGNESVSRVYTIFYLAKTLIKWPYVIMFGIAFICILVIGMKQTYNKKLLFCKKNYQTFILFALIAILPCAWFFVTANHSYIHPRLVYRGWGVTLFSVFAGMISFFMRTRTEMEIGD